MRFFPHDEPYMKSHQRGPLVFSGLVSFWGKNRKVRFGPDPASQTKTPLIAGSSAGARRHATTAPWGMVHRRRRRYRQTTLLPYSRTADHLVRPLGTARETRTDLRGKPRPNELTNAWLESPAVPHLHSDGQRQAVVARTSRRYHVRRYGSTPPPPHLPPAPHAIPPLPGRAPTLGQEQSLTRG